MRKGKGVVRRMVLEEEEEEEEEGEEGRNGANWVQTTLYSYGPFIRERD